MGWFAAIATIFAIGATFTHELKGTKIILSVIYAVAIALFWVITQSFLWALSIAGAVSTVLGYWVMHNFEKRERERRERNRE